MSFIGDILSGGNSTGFTAQSANLVQPATQDQANSAYSTAQNALSQQAAFAQALQAQGNQGMSSQSALTDMLTQRANGEGPNPAAAQLALQTSANTANQAALMAGQRGTGANAGLIARQAAQQGAANQQNAIGQSAALQAQQQIAAQQQLQNLASSQIGQQSSALSGYNQYAQGEQSNILNALGQYNNAQVSNASQQNQANAAIQGQIAGTQSGLLSGALSGLGSAAMSQVLPKKDNTGNKNNYADGGQIPNLKENYVDGGAVSAPVTFESYFSQPYKPHNFAQGGSVGNQLKAGGPVPGKAAVKGDSLKNDNVHAMLSPGEIVIPRSVVNSKNPVEASAKFVAAVLAKKGNKKGK